MVEFISTWAEQIIVALIIVIIFELIIPEGKNKKYIKLVMGLFVLYSIINPILGKKATNIHWNEVLEEFNTVEVSSQNTLSLDSNIEQLYEENIIENIQNTLKEKGYKSNNMKVKIDYEEGENYGSIESIEMNISKEETSGNNDIKIEEVNIENNHTQDSNISDTEIEEIKKIIGDTYNVKYENIIIGR